MSSTEILQLHKKFTTRPPVDILTQSSLIDELNSPSNGARKRSAFIGDLFFGDSGKGAVTSKLNAILAPSGERLVSLRTNGGANAGHETVVKGQVIVTHQLPVAITQRSAEACITKGPVVHPEDLIDEQNVIQKQFGGELPGQLIIDSRVTLALDTHRGLEAALNSCTEGGKGSTGRGISTAYGAFYERIDVTMGQLMAEKWEKTFRQHYRLYRKLTSGFGNDFNLPEIEIIASKNGEGIKRPIGSEAEFIDRLANCREQLRPNVNYDFYNYLKEVWGDEKIPITMEAAQGTGLHPHNGLRPDVTASRTTIDSVEDASYAIIKAKRVARNIGVFKAPYMSSVGVREIPTSYTSQHTEWARRMQVDNDERGRSTGRWRQVYEISMPMAQFFQSVADFDCLVATHMDSAKAKEPIRLVSHYTDRKTGEEKPFIPDQEYVNTLRPHYIKFPGWDGKAIENARRPADLPLEARAYLAFISQTIAPIYMATTGREIDQYISWTP